MSMCKVLTKVLRIYLFELCSVRKSKQIDYVRVESISPSRSLPLHSSTIAYKSGVDLLDMDTY